MRLILLLSLSAAWVTPALAVDAPPVDQPAVEPPVCTTVTTVVKRGEVVLSSSSVTKCEEPSRPHAGVSLHAPGDVLAAPEAVLSAPKAVFGSLSLGDGDELKLRNTAGDWRVVYDRSGDICHVTLSARTTSAGFLARGQGCKGALGEAGAWTFRDGATEILTAEGKLIVRLTGTRDQVTGSTADGDSVTLQR